ncbi:hypothetical protein Z973_11595 [Enterococcus faecium VRE1044]|nr:hypothetical protein Z973_11595 [Enterococcus faecium VRE1044]EZP92562.1 hypothetical protein Z972_10685 [Enterococcus faecium VSE1036]EZP95679.1 hypothetical protein Z974_11145 [Enterococcus faecium VRE1261]EZQ00199.1 hypothetical protein Z971_03510 [Enterococcus faecium VRE0576]
MMKKTAKSTPLFLKQKRTRQCAWSFFAAVR